MKTSYRSVGPFHRDHSADGSVHSALGSLLMLPENTISGSSAIFVGTFPTTIGNHKENTKEKRGKNKQTNPTNHPA